VRELEHVLRAALASTAGREIGVDAFPDAITRGEPPSTPPEDQEQLLRGLLGRHRGNVAEVARDLRTSRSHVLRLIKRFAIDLADVRSRS
jgi:transcriptional regulator of acetoin/glycerol metabolism